MKATETMYVWWLDTKKIAVGPWPDRIGWSRGCDRSSGACFSDFHHMTSEQLGRRLFIDAMKIIVRDGLDPQDVHNAFCRIREYRDGLPPDMPVPESVRDKFYRELETEQC